LQHPDGGHLGLGEHARWLQSAVDKGRALSACAGRWPVVLGAFGDPASRLARNGQRGGPGGMAGLPRQSKAWILGEPADPDARSTCTDLTTISPAGSAAGPGIRTRRRPGELSRARAGCQ